MDVLHLARSGRVRVVLGLVAALSLVLVYAVRAFAVTGSSFEDHDANLVSGGNPDWCLLTQAALDAQGSPNTDVCPGNQMAPNMTVTLDKPSGSTDDSFGQGTSEDDPNPTVVSGSIPPQKDDLTRFYTANEKILGHVFLYLAWERSNLLGSANLDFELNRLRCQAGGTNCASNGVTPVRSQGDVLVRFDFGGSGVPVLSLNQWLTTGGVSKGKATDCISASSYPCWGATPAVDGLDGVTDHQVDLSQAGFANGAVNASPVLDPIAPSAPRTLAGNTTNNGTINSTFGEAGVDLTASGVFPAGVCENLGSAYLKSRSSTSFTAEMKDFIAPQPISITNCGSLIIQKFGPDGTTPLAGAGFTISPKIDGSGTGSTVIADGGTGDASAAPGVVCIDNVFAGTYSVSETTVPGGYFGDTTPHSGITVGTTAGACSDRLNADGTVKTGDTGASTSFTNLLGSIIIKKLDGSGAPICCATFTVSPNPAVGQTGGSADFTDLNGSTSGSGDQSKAPGVVCIDNVRNLGTSNDYTITEKTPPTGYFGDPSSKTVGVHSASTCASRLNTDGTVKSGDSGPTTSFTNHLGSLLIKKFAGDGTTLLPGAGYTITPGVNGSDSTTQVSDGGTGDAATGNDGVVCIDNVHTGLYSIAETTVPTGYFGAPNPKLVTVTSQQTCAARLAGGVASATADTSFVNNLGSLVILKFGPDGSTPLCCATFTISPNPTAGQSGGSLDVTDLNGSTTAGGDQSKAPGVVCVDNVQNLGSGNSYSVTEKTPPSGYFLDSGTRTVTVASASNCANRLNSDGTLKPLDPGPTTNPGFTDKQGSIIVKKLAKNHGAGGTALLGGATFTITPNPFTGTGSLNVTDVSNGTAVSSTQPDAYNNTAGLVCIDGVRNLGLGSYTVSESTPPANYGLDSSTTTLLSSALSQSTCAQRVATVNTSTPADATFTDTPLSQLEFIFRSSAGPGVTATTTFNCQPGVQASPQPTLTPSASASTSSVQDNTYSGLPPGQYTCNVVIDP